MPNVNENAWPFLGEERKSRVLKNKDIYRRLQNIVLMATLWLNLRSGYFYILEATLTFLHIVKQSSSHDLQDNGEHPKRHFLFSLMKFQQFPLHGFGHCL